MAAILFGALLVVTVVINVANTAMPCDPGQCAARRAGERFVSALRVSGEIPRLGATARQAQKGWVPAR